MGAGPGGSGASGGTIIEVPPGSTNRADPGPARRAPRTAESRAGTLRQPPRRGDAGDSSEPPPAHSLLDAWRRDEAWLRGRLIITPHNAFYSDRSMYEARHEAAMTARLFLEQRLQRNRIA